MKDIISMTIGDIKTEIDNGIMRAVRNVGVNVNKEELIKALELNDKLVRCKDCMFSKVYQNDSSGVMGRLIDADKLKEELGKSWAFENTLYDVCRIINETPTIEARPKGEWVEREVLEDTVINEWQSARCSECGKYHTTPYMYYFNIYNYCPNCGADMRGEE